MMRFILATVLICGTFAAQAETLEQTVTLCVKETHDSPGGPINSYAWNRSFDAYLNQGQIIWQGEGLYWFRKCLAKHGVYWK
jgi:hypothetical protein